MPLQSTKTTSPDPSARADLLLSIVRELVAELHPQQDLRDITLDSSLDRDLGIDSLARIELLLRLERSLDVRLPEQFIMSVETPRDLLRVVLGPAAIGSVEEIGRGKGVSVEETAVTPVRAATFVEVLEWHALKHPERTHIVLYDQKGRKDEISYGDLLRGAEAVCAGLRQLDLQPGETVAIMLPTGRDFFSGFYGVLLAGATPVPIYPPLRLRQIEEHIRRQIGILSNAFARVLITFPEARPVSRLLKSKLDRLSHVTTVRELSENGDDRSRPIVQSRDIALLQYTSGSTGAPKGVVLSHANLLANIRAMGAAAEVGSKDVFVSWLPLYHDMGLIGACMGTLYHAIPLILMSPLTFMGRPHRWLWAIHEHRGSISAAPNFAYELCLRAINDDDIRDLDLSSWRLAFNGAEPISPDTLERFASRFAKYGLSKQALTPVYGLAESSVGLAFPPPGRGPVIDRIKRQPFLRTGRAIPADDEDTSALRFVACGRPIPGHQIRIIDRSGHELGEREEGRLQFTGPSATSGYFHNPEATKALFDGEWLNSGDFAYMAGGDVFITGREKDIIIRAGRNIYPQELEEAVGDIARIRKGCVAAFASRDPSTGTERLVILAETRERDPGKKEQLRRQINQLTVDLVGMPADEIVLAPPNTVLKTSSGKIRRAASRKIYESGRIGISQPSVRRQFFRLMLSVAVPQLRRSLRSLVSLIFAAYAWMVFVPSVGVVWVVTATLPGLRRRRHFIRFSSRLFLRLTGTPLSVHGEENIHRGEPCIVVTNHASYLDGLVLSAVLPPTFSFVAKQELNDQFIAGVFLRRIGTRFVERFDPRRSSEDTSKLSEYVRQGHSLVIMPEGTFSRAPGLRPFRMGAFVVAAEAGVPVIPLAIRGTRSVLRGNSRFPRRGVVSINIGESIHPAGSDWSAAIQLRDRARKEILHYCGEPDLSDVSLLTPEA